MRYNILTKNSTKQERIVYEVLKEMKVPFKHRWIISGHEVDFLIGRYILEINGHEQDVYKNEDLARLGYIPVHLQNFEASRENIKRLIKQITK